MEKIILYGNDGDELKSLLIRAFSSLRKIRYFQNNIPSGLYGGGEKTLCLLDYTCPFFPEPSPCLFLFKRAALSFGGMKLPSCYLPVLESGNTPAANMLAHTGGSAVLCGMSPRDTLSLSSTGFPHSMVSIQRDLRTVDNRILEPSEIPVTLSAPAPEYPLLAACAALLLSGPVKERGLYL